MRLDDSRHGTTYGWKLHRVDDETPCDACKAAVAAYEYRRNIDEILGRPRVASIVGFARRVQALQALGWSLDTIAERMGGRWTATRVWRQSARGTYVLAGSLDALCRVYDELRVALVELSRKRGISDKRLAEITGLKVDRYVTRPVAA